MEIFDLALLTAIVVTGYLGPTILRRGGPEQRTYGWMLVADTAIGTLALLGERGGTGGPAGLLGTIAIGGAVCLCALPLMLAAIGRRARMSGRLGLAVWLADVRELLQPGMGARQEREVIEAIREVDAGRVEAAADALRHQRAAIDDPMLRRQLDERLVMTYLYARSWREAASAFEVAYEAPPGLAPPHLVAEMVRAYGELGRLDRAAELLERLESSASAEEPIWALLVNRARLFFLAFVGRAAAVEILLAPGAPLVMTDALRSYWHGVALLHAGDRAGARARLNDAARRSGRDTRERRLAEAMLDHLDTPGFAGPHALPAFVAEMADRVASHAIKPPAEARRTVMLAGVSPLVVPVTSGLIIANLIVAVAVAAVFGSADDLAGLVRAGANLKSAVAIGEWWRLPASMFLHVGVVHLVLNMYGLWVLGRLVEQVQGSVRFFTLYGCAGLGGALASFLVGGPGTSAGASGAVFGLLGAAIADLALRRRAYPERWRGALLGNLLFLTAANVGIGLLYPAIDQAAHLGGLVTGALLTALLSPRLRLPAPVMRGITLALAALCATSFVYAGFGVATTSYADTLARYPRVARALRGVQVTAPSSWQQVAEGELVDPGLAVGFSLEAVDGAIGVEEAKTAALEEQKRLISQELGIAGLEPVGVGATALPSPWSGRDYDLRTGNGAPTFRIVVFARAADERIWVGTLYVPRSLAPDLTTTLAEVLESARATDTTAAAPAGGPADAPAGAQP